MSPPIPIKTEEVILENAEYNSAEELEEELQLQLEDSGGESYHIQYQSEPSQVTPTSQRRQHNMSGASAKSSGSGSNKMILESEKRIRREIANSNERRRMQSINAGFQNLRSLLPRHEGEKLSKAAILQQTSQYICELENQKTQLLAQNSQLKRQLGQHESGTEGTTTNGADGGTLKKRKLTDNVINIQTISDSSDEGLGSMSPEPMTLLTGTTTKSGQVILAHNNKEMLELKRLLDKERRLRTMLEEELQAIKRQLYSVATAPGSATTTYIPREVIEHTDNIMRDHLVDDLPPGSVSYVEIDEVTGQQQVVVCSSIEELESEAAAAAAEIITEDNVHEEVILSSNSSTESEQEVNVNAIAKAYAAGGSPGSAEFQPILHAAIKATPKVEVEHINETIIRVKTEKLEQPGLTRSRQNLETIVEAIRHLEGDHLFADGTEGQKGAQKAQEAPLALTNKQQAAAAAAAAAAASGHQSTRATIAELRPFLQLKGNKQLTIVSGSSAALALSQQLNKSRANAAVAASSSTHTINSAGNTTLKTALLSADKDSTIHTAVSSSNTATPTAILKVQTNQTSSAAAQQVTITTSALKQCRPGVIVAKKLS